MILDKSHQESSEENVPVEQMDDTSAVYGRYHFNFIMKEVLCLIEECPLLEGKSVPELQKELCKAIEQAIEHLTLEGHMYPTVDGEHFKFAG